MSFRRTTDYLTLATHAIRLRTSTHDAVEEKVRRHLVQRMGEMHGLPQKLGQMLSFSAEEKSATAEFSKLQESSEPLPLEDVRSEMESTWGRPLEQVVQAIDPVGRAASLGQVHRATHQDGSQLAIKVQYPNIRQAIQTDLKMLGWLSAPVGNLRRGFDLSSYKEAIVSDLDEELDYRIEAEHQVLLGRQENPFVVVPKVFQDLSGEKVLVSSWEDGDTWNTVREKWSHQGKRQLAEGLLQFFLESLFVGGLTQADWHPGNVRFRHDHGRAQMVLYDFGCVCKPVDNERLALARLIRTTIDGRESPWPLFMKLGFKPQFLEPIAEKLPALCRVLFEPFCVEAPFDTSRWQLGKRTSDILGADRWNFRIAGPANLVFLMRAFHGLKFYMEQLAVSVRWKSPFLNCYEAIVDDAERLSLPGASPPKCRFDGLADSLRIRVEVNGITKVNLTQHARNIEHLNDMLDDDLRQSIASKGINLGDIVSSVRSSGYKPTNIFDLAEDDKRIRVWLE